jgi:hypothetical protein
MPKKCRKNAENAEKMPKKCRKNAENAEKSKVKMLCVCWNPKKNFLFLKFKKIVNFVKIFNNIFLNVKKKYKKYVKVIIQ